MNAQRGAALIMWMFIVLLVLFAIAAVFSYTEFETNTELRDEIALMEQQAKDTEDARAATIQAKADRDARIGFGGSATGGEANLGSVDDAIARLRGKFPTLTEADTTLEKIVAGIEKAYDDEVAAAANWKSKYEQARQAEQAAEDETQSVSDQKDSEIDQLTQQLQAEQDRAARAQRQAQSTIDQQRDQISRLENSAADQAESHKRERNELTNKYLAMDARMQEINTRNRVIREKSGPDGSVINADESLGLVYLDIGAKHGLKRGTPFKVWSYGKGKVKVSKGAIEVTDVRDDYSVARITEQLGTLNPIGKGDQVSNPYFDSGKTPEFVFLGELPGRYNNEEATRILTSKGADVKSQVSANTDFLVVGKKPAGEDVAPLEESEIFRLAELYGVEILAAGELVQYIQY